MLRLLSWLKSWIPVRRSEYEIVRSMLTDSRLQNGQMFTKMSAIILENKKLRSQLEAMQPPVITPVPDQPVDNLLDTVVTET